ncbi:TM0106 family RecB-like putative nuclease [Prochlorococcus marinus]|uniref:DNA repair exonuclease n=1 Tax=Prochlorococcus marinus XMU1408 TaxID=2213228 RepID=A0A318QYB6_PROMR|nr:TM0106 family RecB-like putative nuclease [Prochlorococcus marinus]MBW3041335.1 DNA repair exonuclease [Prochlorococcus marinus str. XMU1408]PYE02507.1 DNA repair exonuclease [Prochlorococcus marinus XMU1408]
MKWNKSKPINDHLLRSWIRCRRKAWLEIYGDKQKKLWTAHSTLQLNHQIDCFHNLSQESYGIGIKACEEGKNIAYGIRLKFPLIKNRILKGNLPILRKTSGDSIWGNFSYQPVLARQGKKVTREHRLILSMTSLLINNLQKYQPKKGLILHKDNDIIKVEKIRLTDNMNTELIDVLLNLERDIQSKIPPPITSNRKKCTICSWRKVCDTVAIKEGNLSEISGIGAKREILLNKIGINNIEELAKIKHYKLKEKLDKFGTQHGDISKKIILQSQSQITNKAIKLNSAKKLTNLKKAKGFLIYDIESDPDIKHDFLHGFIRIPSNIYKEIDLKKIKYSPLLNLEKDTENYLWKRIKRKLNHHEGFPILHYGETEPISLIKLGLRQGASPNEIDAIKNRFIDIHLLIRESWFLPVRNYGLKSIAEFIGFEWEQSNIDGARALLWWRQWKESRRLNNIYSKNLNSIFKYNRDDCIATLMIAKWLIDQD